MKPRISHIFSIYQKSSRVGNCNFLADPPGWFIGWPISFRTYVLSGAMNIIEPFLTPNSPHQVAIISFFLILTVSSFAFAELLLRHHYRQHQTMTDSSNNRSSIDSSLEGPYNSPAILHASTSASPRIEIPEHRPLPPLPTQDDGDDVLNLRSEDDADDELSLYNTSYVPDDKGNRTSSPGVHPGEFHRHNPPQVEMLRTTRSEAGLGTATHDPVTPEIGPESTETSTDHHSSKWDSMSAPTPARRRKATSPRSQRKTTSPNSNKETASSISSRNRKRRHQHHSGP